MPRPAPAAARVARRLAARRPAVRPPVARAVPAAPAGPTAVRELLNRVRQAVVMAEGTRITARDLRLQEARVALQTLGEARLEGERAAIERALLRNGGRLQAAARELGISRVTLYRLMNRHGLRGGEDATGTA